MSAQHTPGPWKVNGHDTHLVVNDRGEFVADCNNPLYDDEGGEIELPEPKANAHLIAAAPDLKDAGNKVLDAFESATIFAALTDEQRAAICALEAAIAKAEGLL